MRQPLLQHYSDGTEAISGTERGTAVKDIIYSSPEMKALAKDNLELIKNGEVEQEQVEELFASCSAKSPVLIQVLQDDVRVLGSCEDIAQVYKETGAAKANFDVAVLVEKAFSEFNDEYRECLSDFQEYDEGEWEDEDDYLAAKEEYDDEVIEREQDGFCADFDEWLKDDWLVTPDNFNYMLESLALQRGCTDSYHLNLWTEDYLELYDGYIKEEIEYITDVLDCVIYVDYEFVTPQIGS